MSIVISNLNQIVGLELLEYNHETKPEHCASGGEEITLSFTNGKEILIYADKDGNIHVEGD
jgi:hypothetical protein